MATPIVVNYDLGGQSLDYYKALFDVPMKSFSDDEMAKILSETVTSKSIDYIDKLATMANASTVSSAMYDEKQNLLNKIAHLEKQVADEKAMAYKLFMECGEVIAEKKKLTEQVVIAEQAFALSHATYIADTTELKGRVSWAEASMTFAVKLCLQLVGKVCDIETTMKVKAEMVKEFPEVFKKKDKEDKDSVK